MQEGSRRPIYLVNDRIPVPVDVPDLGVEKGDEGIIRELVFRDSVTALVEIPYSTGQTRGWISVQTLPEKKVLSYALEG
jgi:hypothetical protein